jgi:hypothetical protein
LDWEPIPPRGRVEELPLEERSPRFVSVRAAVRLALLSRAAKPAKPFDEVLALDLLATLANAACLTRAGELRRAFLIGWRSSGGESSSIEERDGDGLALLFPFEGRLGIRGGGSGYERLSLRRNGRGGLISVLKRVAQFKYQKADQKNINYCDNAKILLIANSPCAHNSIRGFHIWLGSTI